MSDDLQHAPADVRRALLAAEQADVAKLMQAFATHYGAEAVPVQRIADDAKRSRVDPDPERSALFRAVNAVLKGRPISREALGHWFTKRAGWVVDGRRFVRSGGGSRARFIALLDGRNDR